MFNTPWKVDLRIITWFHPFYDIMVQRIKTREKRLSSLKFNFSVENSYIFFTINSLESDTKKKHCTVWTVWTPSLPLLFHSYKKIYVCLLLRHHQEYHIFLGQKHLAEKTSSRRDPKWWRYQIATWFFQSYQTVWQTTIAKYSKARFSRYKIDTSRCFLGGCRNVYLLEWQSSRIYF